jgi:SAM-dependent methyltransferase
VYLLDTNLVLELLLEDERLFAYLIHHAQALPYPSSTFDAVVANHMLYHVPDKPRALSEIRRVLVPGGRFCAATNGKDHMRELRELSRKVKPEAERQIGSVTASFTLENGAHLLWPWFPRLTCVRQENALRVAEVGPVLAYLASTQAMSEKAAVASGESRPALRTFVGQNLCQPQEHWYKRNNWNAIAYLRD